MTTPIAYLYRIDMVVRVVDGDTVDLLLSREVDLGFRITVKGYTIQRVRLLRADTPERGQAGYVEATEFTRNWFIDKVNLLCRTEKSDVFGRYLADITQEDTGACLNDDLIAAGHAVLWTR